MYILLVELLCYGLVLCSFILFFFFMHEEVILCLRWMNRGRVLVIFIIMLCGLWSWMLWLFTFVDGFVLVGLFGGSFLHC